MNKQIGNNLSDKHLVELVLSGNTNAFSMIIKYTEGLVAQIVFKMIPNATDRKDIAQDIYLKAFNKLTTFKFQSKLSTWVAKIAYNTCLNWLQKKTLVLPGNANDHDQTSEQALEILRLRSTDPLSSETETLIFNKQLSGILQVEINSLPPVFKALVTLYHQEGLSYGEMAQITELPEGTVKNYLFRARKMLKENLLVKFKKEAL